MLLEREPCAERGMNFEQFYESFLKYLYLYKRKFDAKISCSGTPH